MGPDSTQVLRLTRHFVGLGLGLGVNKLDTSAGRYMGDYRYTAMIQLILAFDATSTIA